jgi:hypothetical protein
MLHGIINFELPLTKMLIQLTFYTKHDYKLNIYFDINI